MRVESSLRFQRFAVIVIIIIVVVVVCGTAAVVGVIESCY